MIQRLRQWWESVNSDEHKGQSWLLALTAFLCVLVAGISFAFVISKKPRDVDANVTASTKIILSEVGSRFTDVQSQLKELRESVNHARELAAKNDRIVTELNAEIVELKAELRELNGKK